MEYTIERIEQELQDILYHLEELKFNPDSENAHYQISGLIRSANQIAEYAEDLRA